jgi:hypothetical protein
MPYQIINHITELQQQLLIDDVYLPDIAQDISELNRYANLETNNGNPEPVRDGINRPVSDDPFLWMRKPPFSNIDADELATYNPHCWSAKTGDYIAYRFDKPTFVKQAVLLLDSNLERSIAFKAPGWQEPFPENLPKKFRLEILNNGNWEIALAENDNSQRQIYLAVNKMTDGIRFVLDETYGGTTSRIYGFFIN